MEFVEDDLGRDRRKGLVLEEVNKGRLIRFWQPQVAIDILGQVLREQPQLHKGTCRIGKRVGFGEAPEFGKLGPSVTEDLEVGGLHAVDSASAFVNSSRFVMTTGVSCRPSSAPAASSRSRFWK